MVIWSLSRACLRARLQDKATLIAENLALRQQLIVLHRGVPRPPLEDGDRAFWVNLATLWSGWRSALLIVKPATVMRWHRMGFLRYRRWKRRPGGGRPSTPFPARQLIRKMSRSNPIWGAPRIRVERARGGLTISEATAAMGIEEVRTAKRSPWQNAYSERVIGTIRREGSQRSWCLSPGRRERESLGARKRRGIGRGRDGDKLTPGETPRVRADSDPRLKSRARVFRGESVLAPARTQTEPKPIWP
jgi:hypothetical protein